MNESTIGWIGAVRSSRQPLRGFLRMRDFLNAIKSLPHPEERPKGASRRTHGREQPFVSILSLPLELAGGAGRRPLGANPEPLGDLRHGRKVDLRRPRPGENAGDVEIGNRELVAKQVG